MSLDQALQHWEDASCLIDELLDDSALMPQAMSLAARYEHTVYGMLYIAAALAQELCICVTPYRGAMYCKTRSPKGATMH